MVTIKDVMDAFNQLEKENLIYLKHPVKWIKLEFAITPVCDCGAEKCKSTHYKWCSTNKKTNS
jgi:hypothetical protein